MYRSTGETPGVNYCFKGTLSPVTAHVPNFDFPTGCRNLKRCASSVTEPSKILVVVNFLSQVISLSLSFFFFGMVMYTNEVETKEKEKLPEIKKLTTLHRALLSSILH